MKIIWNEKEKIKIKKMSKKDKRYYLKMWRVLEFSKQIFNCLQVIGE